MKWEEYTFPVRMRGRIEEKTVTGVKLTDLLDDLKESDVVCITNEAGIRYRYRGGDLICSRVDHLPAVIFLDESGQNKFRSHYRLAVGRQYPEQYNGRQWVRYIYKIEIDHDQ